jgi:hypothetical protein
MKLAGEPRRYAGAHAMRGRGCGPGEVWVTDSMGSYCAPIEKKSSSGREKTMNTRRTGSAKAKARPSKTRGRVKRARLRRTKGRKIRVRST